MFHHLQDLLTCAPCANLQTQLFANKEHVSQRHDQFLPGLPNVLLNFKNHKNYFVNFKNATKNKLFLIDPHSGAARHRPKIHVRVVNLTEVAATKGCCETRRLAGFASKR